MNCQSCGKDIPDESAFCLFCGEKITPQVEPPDSLIGWEFKELFIPNQAFSPKSKIILQNRNEPEPSDLEKLWTTYLPQISGLLQSETDQDWSIPPDYLEPDCLLVEIRSRTFKDYTRPDWIGLIVLSIFSVGIYLVFAPVVNTSTTVIQPLGVNIKLRRHKPKDNIFPSNIICKHI